MRRYLTERQIPERYDPASFIRILREYSEELTRVTTYTGSGTWNPGSISDGDQATTTITVPGVILGALHGVRCFSEISLSGLQLTGYVSADATVTLVLSNTTGGPVDLDSATYGVVVENFVKT